MSSVRRFSFDDSFDAESPFARPKQAAKEPEPVAPAPPPPPPPPTFTQADMEKAWKQGYDEGEKAGNGAGYGKGFTDGLTAGKKDGVETARKEFAATADAHIADALQQIAGGVAQLLAERNATNVMRRDQPVHIALAVLRKILPETAKRGGLNEIEALTRQAMTDLIDEPRFVVRVAEGMLGEVRPRLEEMAESSGFTARLIVVGDPALGGSDCRIEWAEGGIERDTNQLLEDVSRVVEQLLEAP
jgi:flagellar assembly protein FliH